MTLNETGTASPTILITGAAGGIGAACAARFVAEQWRVIGWDRQAGDDARVSWQTLDVSDWDAVAATAATLPPLAAVVNGAGIGARASALETSREEWDRVIAINLSAAFYVARVTFDALREGRGTLVNIASITATSGFRNRAPYSATKAALVSLTRSLAIEWAEYDIRVVSVSPTFTRTPLYEQGVREGKTDADSIIRHTPQRRVVEPEEVAGAIYQLVGPDFYALTGSNVLIDAGFDAFSGF